MAKLHSVRIRIRGDSVEFVPYAQAARGAKAARGSVTLKISRLRSGQATTELTDELGLSAADAQRF